MPTFIIRNQGFFYTDEYYAPGDRFKRVVQKTFATKAAAETACAALVRTWVRSESVGDYVFDDHDAIEKIVAYYRTTWPEQHGALEWDYRLTVPEDATDDQVDAIVKCMGVTFAQVFEVEDEHVDADEDDAVADEDDDDDDDGESDDDFDDGDLPEYDPDDELHFGPTR